MDATAQNRVTPNQLPGLGVSVDSVTGTSYIVACGNLQSNTDGAHIKLFSNPASTSVTLFKAGSCAFSPSFVIGFAGATGAGPIVITPTTSTIGLIGSAQTSQFTIRGGQVYFVYTDTSTSTCIPNGCYDVVPLSIANGFQTLTDSSTVTWNVISTPYGNATLTFTVHSGSRTLNMSGMIPGGNYVLQIIQDGTGGEGLTLGTGCAWKVSGGGGGAIVPSTGANARDILAFTYDGTNCYLNFSTNFN